MLIHAIGVALDGLSCAILGEIRISQQIFDSAVTVVLPVMVSPADSTGMRIPRLTMSGWNGVSGSG